MPGPGYRPGSRLRDRSAGGGAHWAIRELGRCPDGGAAAGSRGGADCPCGRRPRGRDRRVVPVRGGGLRVLRRRRGRVRVADRVPDGDGLRQRRGRRERRLQPVRRGLRWRPGRRGRRPRGRGGGPGGGCDPNALEPVAGCETPDDPEPCDINSTSPVLNALNDPIIQQALNRMWEQSNADAPSLWDRQETVGVLIPNGDGTWRLDVLAPHLYREGKRTWNRAEVYLTNLPAGAVLVHTHPVTPGERKRDPMSGRYIGYDPDPSTDDRRALNQLGISTGLFLDGGKIQQYGPTTIQDGPSASRCGY